MSTTTHYPPLKDMKIDIIRWAATARPEDVRFIWLLISGKWAR